MANKNDPLSILVMAVRQALLMIVDAIEVFVNVKYRTATLRKDYSMLREKMFAKKNAHDKE